MIDLEAEEEEKDGAGKLSFDEEEKSGTKHTRTFVSQHSIQENTDDQLTT